MSVLNPAIRSEFPPFRSGDYIHGGADSALGSQSLPQDRESCVPFYVPIVTTFDRIACFLVTGQTGGVIRLGIRQPSNRRPGTLILDAGTTAATATESGTQRDITINQTLNPGWYWLSLAAQGAANITVTGVSGSHPMVSWSAAPANAYASIHQTPVAGALPSTFTPTGPSTLGPRVWLRAA